MPSKPSLELSEVQLKVIEELDLLTDAFVSTFTQIGKIIKTYSEEISIIVDNNFKDKVQWRPYPPKCFDLSFMPFRDYIYTEKFSIDNLTQCFYVAGQRTLIKELKIEDKKKEVDYLSLSWGFGYEIEEHEKYFYVEVEKGKGSGVANFSKTEYENFANELKIMFDIKEPNFYYLEHPDDGDTEYFNVALDFKYADKVSKFFEVCKKELIEKYLLKIKD